MVTRLKQEIHVNIKHQTEDLTAACAAKDAYYLIYTNAQSSNVNSTSQDINLFLYTRHGNSCNNCKGSCLQ